MDPMEMRGTPVVQREDAMRGLRQMRPGVRYPARDLYQRYVDLMEADSRDPGHKVSFGQMLGKLGLIRCQVSVSGQKVKGWML